MNALRRAWLVLLTAIATGAFAADAPVIRTRIAPASVIIGQPVTLAIDILVPTWFGGGIEYPATVAIPEAIAKLSDERPVNLNERIGDASYAGMSKNYLIVPQKAGAFEVPAVTIRVPYAVDGKTVVAELRTAPQRFEARLPPGAADLGYFISTRSYRLTQQVDPAKIAEMKVGDAITRTIVQRAADLAPMFLPALAFEPIDGLELYPAAPVLAETGGERGAARMATRTDAVTYVLAKPGRFRLPGMRIGWFDPGQSAMRWAEVPELAFDVAAGPAAKVVDAGAARAQLVTPSGWRVLGARWREIVAPGLALLLLGASVWWLLPHAQRWMRKARARRAASEATAFRGLRAAIRTGDPAGVRRNLARWAAIAMPDGSFESLSRFAAAHGAKELATQMAALDRELYADAGTGGPGRSRATDERGLLAVRARLMQAGRERIRASPALTPLNPPDAQPRRRTRQP